MAQGEGDGGVQLALAGVPGARAPRRTRRAGPHPLADHLPVARVVVDRPQPHLDRPFEYAVPEVLADAAQAGVRVRVRFGGQDVDAYLLERSGAPEHDGELMPLRRVVSPEVVLRPEVLDLARAVARRYAGTLSDVLRLAVPPRHARVEGEGWGASGDAPGTGHRADQGRTLDGDENGVPDDGSRAATRTPAGSASLWEPYSGGAAFLRRLVSGESPRAVWGALPGPNAHSWAESVAEAVTAAVAGDRGALVVAPSGAEVAVLEEALTAAGVPAWEPGATDGWVRLLADDGPAVRYRSFLAASRGAARVVVGTRAATFAPVRDLGLVVCWDDGDPLHSEPRAPYPHARDVLALRAELAPAALLVGGYARSVATQRWLATGWARPLVAPRDVVRRRTPRVTALTSVELAREGPAAAARLPGAAWRAVRDGLARGPVLVQVPRAGYVPSVACQRCRTLARCTACSGPLGVPEPGSPPRCRRCGRLAAGWHCPECSATELRSVRVGSDRTAEEIGRAFPGVPVKVSSASTGVLSSVGARPALVVSTPGAEPAADGGYAAALLLDAAVVTARPGLDVPEQALRSWFGAASLVRPAHEGGVVLLVGDGAVAPTQALVRWDPATLAERELAERASLRLPPAVHLVAIDGPRDAVELMLSRMRLPAAADVLGPLAVESPRPQLEEVMLLDPETRRPVRALVRAPWSASAQVAAEVAAAVAVRSTHREPGTVRVQVEPVDLL